jgi:O-antigen/teichoic acid export membrane protein
MEKSNKKFIQNSLLTLSRQFISIVIGVLLLTIIARVLGPENQGKYTLITLVPLMLQTFLNLGINSATIYYVSKKEVDLNTAFNTNVFTGLLLSILSVLIGILAIQILSSTKLEGVDLGQLYLVLAALPFMFLMIFLQTIFQGLQDFKMFNSMLVVQQTGNLILVSLLLFVFKMSLTGAILAFIIGYLLSVCFVLFSLLKKYNVRISLSYFSWAYFKKSFSYGMKTHVSNVMTFLNYRTPLLILGMFFNPTAVGIYSVAVNFGEKLSIFSQSISSVLLPRVASMSEDSDKNYITSIISKSMLIFITILSIGVFFLSDFIFQLLLAEDYNDYIESVRVLNFLLPGLALLSIEKLLSNDLAARGKPEVNMYLSFVNVIVNVSISFILIPTYGVIGAAVATSITYIISFALKVIIFAGITNQSIANFLIINKQDLFLYKRLLNVLIKKRKFS